MSQNPLIEILEANHLLRSPNEVATFEQTLAELAQNSDSADLASSHRENSTKPKTGSYNFWIGIGVLTCFGHTCYWGDLLDGV